MDKITRYLFILVCLVAFLILAPLIVLYVSGTSVDLDNRDYRQTGIFTVETQPDDAEVSINNGSPEKTPATIRFLPLGEYDIKITKPGYFDWTKRLPIEPGKVTYGHEGVDAVNLIKQPVPQILAPGVTSFMLVDNTIWYGGAGKISFASLDNPTAATAIPLPITPSSITMLRNTNYLLAQNEAGKKIIIDRGLRQASPLPDAFNAAEDVHVTHNGSVLARIGTTVQSYDFATKSTTDHLTEVVGFTLVEATAYIATREVGETTLQAIEWNGSVFTDAEPLLSTVLPNAENIKIYITGQKELFALANEVLYRINAKPEVVSAHVSSVQLDYGTNELTFRTPSELWFYNFLRARPQLLTRNTAPVNDYKIRSALGYGFIASPAGLELLEIDARHHQNHYVLLQGKPVWSAAITDNLKTVVALENDQLLLIPIQ